MIITLAAALALATPAPKDALKLDRAAIKHVETTRRGVTAHVTSIVVSGDYAIAHGVTGSGEFHDGLRLGTSGWSIVCALGKKDTTTAILNHCGFPEDVALQLAEDELANDSVQQGDFTTAQLAEEHAFQLAPAPQKSSEMARAQLLAQLKTQLGAGQITRQQAIQKWNSFALTWFLP